VSRWLLTYLRDYRADALEALQERWLSGGLELATEHELKGRMLALGEVAELPFSAVADFYHQRDALTHKQSEEDDDGSETAKDDAG
jgi:hypothetical protein